MPVLSKAEKSSEIARAIRPLLAGHPPVIQGAALAELLALWLAGHRATNEVRFDLLQMHVNHVKDLIPIMEKEIGAMLNKTGIQQERPE